MQIRAERYGIKHELPILWMLAEDASDELRGLSPQDLQDKRVRWLQRHDKDTHGIIGVMPLIHDLPVRLTETIDKKLKLFRWVKWRHWQSNYCYIESNLNSGNGACSCRARRLALLCATYD